MNIFNLVKEETSDNYPFRKWSKNSIPILSIHCSITLFPQLPHLPLSPSLIHYAFNFSTSPSFSSLLGSPFPWYTVFLSFPLSLSVILIVSLPPFSPLPPTLTHLAGCLLFKPLLYPHKYRHTHRNEERVQQRWEWVTEAWGGREREREGNLVWLQTLPSHLVLLLKGLRCTFGVDTDFNAEL